MRPTRTLPAARTRTASIFSSFVGGTSRGGGAGRIEKEVVVFESGTAQVSSKWGGIVGRRLELTEGAQGGDVNGQVDDDSSHVQRCLISSAPCKGGRKNAPMLDPSKNMADSVHWFSLKMRARRGIPKAAWNKA
jgi:hypothetical protein